MHLWKIYVQVFSVISVLSALGRIFLFFKKPGLVSRIDVFEGFVGLLALPALFGFAYQRPYGHHLVWVFLSILVIILSAYQFFTPKMKKVYQMGWVKAGGLIGAQALLGVPALWALLKYSFWQPALWK